MDQEPIGNVEKGETAGFEIDESKIKIGQPDRPIMVATDGGRTKNEFTHWASYEGSVDGYYNITGYGNSEEEARQSLRDKIQSYVENKNR